MPQWVAKMAVLPSTLAAVLAVTATQTMILLADTLTPEECIAASVMACTKALGGAVVAVVRRDELKKVLEQAASAQETEAIMEMEDFRLAEVIEQQ